MAKESYKEQEKRHVRAMEKAGVSKKIVEEEKKEAGMKKGGKVEMPKAKDMGKLGMARGGSVEPKTPAKKMRGGGMCK
jgi:hypothetical protein